ncbi:MAG: phage tail protein [Burkholderiaceae bacterium]|jgi:phage-related protein|nr:phage tail protein [Burkholderiaceae bacterium]
MATFTIAPDFSSPMSKQPRVLTAQFGDGYQQRVGDGINIAPEEWSLRFSTRTPAERDAILAFLEARNGVESFDWTSPRGTVGKFICPTWSYTPDNAATNTVTATFRQVFGS